MVMAAEGRLSNLDPATVVLGIMTTDLDRAVLSVRTAPKPRGHCSQSDRAQTELCLGPPNHSGREGSGGLTVASSEGM